MKFLLPYTKSRSSKEATLYSVEDSDGVKDDKSTQRTEAESHKAEVTETSTYVSASDTDEQYVTFVHNSSEPIQMEETVRISDQVAIERYNSSPVPDTYEPELKRKRGGQDLDDADLNFFRSLLPDMQMMSASQKRRFKMGIFGLIDKVLTEGDCST